MECEVHEEHQDFFYGVGVETLPIRFRPFRLNLLIALQYTYFFIWGINICYTSISLVFDFFQNSRDGGGGGTHAWLAPSTSAEYIPEADFTDSGQENDPTATSDFRTMKFI
jgi:hypothetical protein